MFCTTRVAIIPSRELIAWRWRAKLSLRVIRQRLRNTFFDMVWRFFHSVVIPFYKRNPPRRCCSSIRFSWALEDGFLNLKRPQEARHLTEICLLRICWTDFFLRRLLD